MTAPTDPSQPFGNARAQQRARAAAAGRWTWCCRSASTCRGDNGAFEFRGEFFNLLNRTNFRAPNGNRSAGAYGTITTTYDPRIIQFGFKASF